MDDRNDSFSPDSLYPQLGSHAAPIIIDVADDHQMPKPGMVMYDALYTWCRSLQAKTHNWPARAVGT